MTDPEFYVDKYDKFAAWALGYWKWEKYCRIKKYGFMNLKEKYKETSYESIPVDTVEIWKATGRNLTYDDITSIMLDEKTQTLIFPNMFKSDIRMVRQVVARELGFVCTRTRSHLLSDITNKEFTKQKIINAKNDGGFLGNMVAGLYVIGMMAENSEHEKIKKQELDEAWKVASAILVPINAIIVFNKRKTIKEYTDIIDLFGISNDMLSTYLTRVKDKIDNYDSSYLF